MTILHALNNALIIIVYTQITINDFITTITNIKNLNLEKKMGAPEQSLKTDWDTKPTHWDLREEFLDGLPGNLKAKNIWLVMEVGNEDADVSNCSVKITKINHDPLTKDEEAALNKYFIEFNNNRTRCATPSAAQTAFFQQPAQTQAATQTAQAMQHEQPLASFVR